MSAFVYLLECSDGSYYVGSTIVDLDRRIAEHNQGLFRGYTFTRRPVKLVWSEHFERLSDAAEAERKIKGWSRSKKRALIIGDWDLMRQLAKRPSARRKEPSS